MTSIDAAISGLLAAQQGAVQQQIAFALAGKQLDSQQQQGAAVAQLLQAAVQLSKSTTTGANVDTVA